MYRCCRGDRPARSRRRRTGAELLTFFTSHSRTPLPQSISYLDDDLARNTGDSTSASPAAPSDVRPDHIGGGPQFPVAEALSLRALAPTVAVTSEP